MENDLRSARTAIFGSISFLTIAMTILVVFGQPVGSFSSESAPGTAEGSASPVATPVTKDAVAQVAIRKLTYRPFRVTIPIGGRVEWTNFDGVPHTVTARDAFDSGRIDLRACYGLFRTIVMYRWTIRQAKAMKCRPRTVSGNRS